MIDPEALDRMLRHRYSDLLADGWTGVVVDEAVVRENFETVPEAIEAFRSVMRRKARLDKIGIQTVVTPADWEPCTIVVVRRSFVAAPPEADVIWRFTGYHACTVPEVDMYRPAISWKYCPHCGIEFPELPPIVPHTSDPFGYVTNTWAGADKLHALQPGAKTQTLCGLDIGDAEQPDELKPWWLPGTERARVKCSNCERIARQLNPGGTS